MIRIQVRPNEPLESALRRFKLVRESEPDYPGLQHRLGLCYAKLGLGPFAVESLRKALEQMPPPEAVGTDDLGGALHGPLRGPQRRDERGSGRAAPHPPDPTGPPAPG